MPTSLRSRIPAGASACLSPSTMSSFKRSMPAVAISATQVRVDVSRDTSGLYVYTYSYTSPSSNKGIIDNFFVDLTCAAVVDRSGLPPQPKTPGFRGSASPDGKHAPVNVL